MFPLGKLCRSGFFIQKSSIVNFVHTLLTIRIHCALVKAAGKVV